MDSMPTKKKPNATLYLKRKISRLTKEIAEIDAFFYLKDADGDLAQDASMLERKRDDIVRSAVLQLHTAIEDVLTSWIVCRYFGVGPTGRKAKERTTAGRALLRLLDGKRGTGFDKKLDFAVALALITTKTRAQLVELNELRNKCSHNWLLRVPVRKKRRPRQLKPPLLQFKGGNLHDVAVFKAMAGEYGLLYARLFVRYLDG